MPIDMFKSFNFNGKPAAFCVSLDILLSCVNDLAHSRDDFGTYPVTLRYASVPGALELEFDEPGVVTRCTIRTRDPDDLLDFGFNVKNVVNKFIMKSAFLKETFQELDSSSACVEFFMCPEQNLLKITTKGRFGTSYVEFSENSDAVEVWQCCQRQEYCYRMQLVKPSTKALTVSKKFSIRIDHRGVLSLQHMVLDHNGQHCFFEFLVISLLTQCSPEIIV